MNVPVIKLPDAILTLRDEHRYMYMLLETLQEELQADEFSAPEDYFLMQDIVRYMHEYPDVEHHPTEDLMFDKLVQRNPASELDVARLRREHGLLKKNTADILTLLDSAARRRTAKANEALRVAIANYVDRLREHMRFEESELFPSAVRCLANKDWHAIDMRLEAAQDPLFGQNVQHEYRQLYEYFSNRADQLSRQMARYGFLQLDNMILSADAIETGMGEMWDMLQDQVASLAQEFRNTTEKSLDGRSVLSVIAVQAGYAGLVGKTACNVGGKATMIYFSTLKNAVVSLFKGSQ